MSWSKENDYVKVMHTILFTNISMMGKGIMQSKKTLLYSQAS